MPRVKAGAHAQITSVASAGRARHMPRVRAGDIRSVGAAMDEASPTRLRIVGFGPLRDMLDGGIDLTLDTPAPSVAEVWEVLVARIPTLRPWHPTLRFARGDTLVGLQTTLVDGDELALLPPVGGG